MTDKELFEKTEKAFNLNKKNPVIEKVYDKGNFKSLLENTSPVSSNYGANTVSAARGLGRGVAKTGGALAKGLGALGKFAREVIPGTRTSRMRTAEVKKAEAQARAEELKNMQMRQKLASGDNDDQKKQHKMDKYVEKIYGRNPQFAAAYDKVVKGENLNKAEQKDYDDGIKQADKLRAGDDIEKGKKEAIKEIHQQTEKSLMDETRKSAPSIYTYLSDPKHKDIKDTYLKFLLQDPNYGIPTDANIAELGLSYFTPIFKKNPNEVNSFTRLVRNKISNSNINKILIDNIPEGLKRKNTGTGKTGKSRTKLKPSNALETLKAQASSAGRSLEQQKTEMLRRANIFKDKIDKTVYGKAGGAYQLKEIDPKIGLMKLKDKNNNDVYFFPNQLSQPQLELDIKESFEQIVKRYR